MKQSLWGLGLCALVACTKHMNSPSVSGRWSEHDDVGFSSGGGVLLVFGGHPVITIRQTAAARCSAAAFGEKQMGPSA